MATVLLREETGLALKGRRARRVIRRIDPWSVLKFSVVFYLCMYAILLVAGVILWLTARSVGIIDNVESFIEDLFALDRFRFRAGQLLRGSALGGLAMVVLGAGANVLAAVLYNLISDVVGGVQITVLEEERPPPKSA